MKISGDVSPAQAMPSSMPLSECGSGWIFWKRRVRQPSKSFRKTGTTFSSNGWGSDCEDWAPTKTRCETRSGWSIA